MNALKRNFILLMACLCGVMVMLAVFSITLANHLLAG